MQGWCDIKINQDGTVEFTIKLTKQVVEEVLRIMKQVSQSDDSPPEEQHQQKTGN